MSDKIKTLNQLARIVAEQKKQGKKVSLLTGCFDVIHAGHIDFFRFAAHHSDIVVVGLESDKSVSLSKGKDRPIHNIRQRSKVLSEFQSITYVFTITQTVQFGKAYQKVYENILKQINPDYIIVNKTADTYWRGKREMGKSFGVKLLTTSKKRESSSTSIIEKLLKRSL